MLYATVLTYLVYYRAGCYEVGAAGRVVRDTARKMSGSSIGILMMVLMAVIMTHAGMTDALARGLAEGIGQAFPLLSPWIGALGAFMTGSNVNSNVVFTDLQAQTAGLLGFSLAWILAAQTSGGAIGSVIAPTKILVGASTAGMNGREGEIIAALARYIAGLMVVVTIALLFFLGAVS
jgi:lactate permease